MFKSAVIVATSLFSVIAFGQPYPPPQAISLSFISTGSGIDTQAYDRVETVIQEELDANTVLTYVVQPWGREGERDVCVQLNSVEANVRLVAELNDIIASSGNLVSMKFPRGCNRTQDSF